MDISPEVYISDYDKQQMQNKSISGNCGTMMLTKSSKLKINVNSQANNNATQASTLANYSNISVSSGATAVQQYHRRKVATQEHQSHLCYKNNDFLIDRCHAVGEDYFSSVTGALPTTPSSPSTISSLQQQQSIQQTTDYESANNIQTANCSSSNSSISCGNSRAAATQTSNNNLCNINSDQQDSSPVLYTVHRVVATAQIQTEAGNTFATSSSVSSVVSTVQRNHSNCYVTGSSNGGLFFGTNGLHQQNSPCLNLNITRYQQQPTTKNQTPSIQKDSETEEQIIITGPETIETAHQQQYPSLSTSSTNNVCSGSHRKHGNSLGHILTSSSPMLDCGLNASGIGGCLAGINNNSAKPRSRESTIVTSSISRPLLNVIPTCVYLMSRIAVHMEIEGTAQCPAQVMLAAALGCEELGIANKLLAQSIFGLWMTSTLIEIQLKSHHRPYIVRVSWPNLLEKYSQGNPVEKQFDEPMIFLKRNVFFSKKDEEKIKDPRILELLYEEAKHNVLAGRYIMEPVHSIMLGGIQCRIELGPYNSHTHTISYFREHQSRFLPQHVAKNTSWSWLPISRKHSAEVKLLEQYKRVPHAATTRKLMRKYLEFCWALPFYGAAFFHGQIEQSVRGIMSLVNHKDTAVAIAINERGVFVIEPLERTLLLGLRYEDLSWDFAKPSLSDDSDCQTCIFIQFDAVENGISVSKLLQVFSRQAAMMDALIGSFADQMRRRRQESEGKSPEHQIHDEPNPIQNNGKGVLCNKLSRLTLATYDDEGRCIGQMGSLSISY